MVKHVGSKIDLRQFSRLYDRITRFNSCKVKDSNNATRNIQIHYVRSYSAENNQWGDFQVGHLFTLPQIFVTHFKFRLTGSSLVSSALANATVYKMSVNCTRYMTLCVQNMAVLYLIHAASSWGCKLMVSLFILLYSPSIKYFIYLGIPLKSESSSSTTTSSPDEEQTSI